MRKAHPLFLILVGGESVLEALGVKPFEVEHRLEDGVVGVEHVFILHFQAQSSVAPDPAEAASISSFSSTQPLCSRTSSGYRSCEACI